MAKKSSIPLVKKLEIEEGHMVLLHNVPDAYLNLMEYWPDNITNVDFDGAENMDFIHFFTREMAELEVTFPALKKKLKKGGGLWISWPKGSSKLPKDLNGNDVRSIGLANGLVDVKVCSIDDDWSALKFMYRKKIRQ